VHSMIPRRTQQLGFPQSWGLFSVRAPTICEMGSFSESSDALKGRLSLSFARISALETRVADWPIRQALLIWSNAGLATSAARAYPRMTRPAPGRTLTSTEIPRPTVQR